jgi:benzoate membrane transport protein
MSIWREFSPRNIPIGVLAAFVGFASSFAVILKGLNAVGASPGQAASGLMVLSIGMGICGILMSVMTRQPISIVWSTPGGALLAASPALAGGFPVAVGAFVFCAALIVLCGLWKPLGRAVVAIPSPLANAMLGGIMLHLCLAPVQAIAELPLEGVIILVVWAVVARLKRLMAVPAAVAVAAILITLHMQTPQFGALAPHLEFIQPQFSLAAMVGIGLPLFIVTMASQNIPGLAVLKINGFVPESRPLFISTGLFSGVVSLFGGSALNLAAVTAAMCAGEESHPDPAKRYWTAIIAGIAYVVFGFCAGAITAFVSVAPPLLIESVAGLALLGTFSGALVAAFTDVHHREAAALTFLVTAFGLTFFGIGGAFWGLLAGGILMLLKKWRE